MSRLSVGNPLLAGRRGVLRARTAELHASLDLALGEIVSMENYRTYLAMVLRFRRAVEPPMVQTAAPFSTSLAGNGFMPTMILDAAEQDCRDLRIASPEAVLIHRPPAGPDEWIGAAYVLEGAGFGARVLSGRAGRLGLGPRHGARHLHRQARAGGNWKTFVTGLERAGSIDLDRAAEEANRLFRLALECVAPEGPDLERLDEKYLERREFAGQC